MLQLDPSAANNFPGGAAILFEETESPSPASQFRVRHLGTSMSGYLLTVEKMKQMLQGSYKNKATHFAKTG